MAGWAFSAADAYASALSIKKSIPFTPLSAQYFIDCDIYDSGCLGGLQYMAWMFAKEKGYFLE